MTDARLIAAEDLARATARTPRHHHTEADDQQDTYSISHLLTSFFCQLFVTLSRRSVPSGKAILRHRPALNVERAALIRD
jgi:hypothetical protein